MEATVLRNFATYSVRGLRKQVLFLKRAPASAEISRLVREALTEGGVERGGRGGEKTQRTRVRLSSGWGLQWKPEALRRTLLPPPSLPFLPPSSLFPAAAPSLDPPTHRQRVVDVERDLPLLEGELFLAVSADGHQARHVDSQCVGEEARGRSLTRLLLTGEARGEAAAVGGRGGGGEGERGWGKREGGWAASGVERGSGLEEAAAATTTTRWGEAGLRAGRGLARSPPKYSNKNGARHSPSAAAIRPDKESLPTDHPPSLTPRFSLYVCVCEGSVLGGLFFLNQILF